MCQAVCRVLTKEWVSICFRWAHASINRVTPTMYGGVGGAWGHIRELHARCNRSQGNEACSRASPYIYAELVWRTTVTLPLPTLCACRASRVPSMHMRAFKSAAYHMTAFKSVELSQSIFRRFEEKQHGGFWIILLWQNATKSK